MRVAQKPSTETVPKWLNELDCGNALLPAQKQVFSGQMQRIVIPSAWRRSSPSQISGNRSELIQRRVQILGNFGGDDVRIVQIGRVLQVLNFEPEDVQAQLVAL